MTETGRKGVPWAGMVSGPLAWAISTHLNYALSDSVCTGGADPTPWFAVGLALAALSGGALSWPARCTGVFDIEQRSGQTNSFLAWLGVWSSVLFAAVILLQAAAGFVFSGCER